jgi:hypothetical protein
MQQVSRIAWAGLAGFGGVSALGLVLAGGSAVAEGDWYLARMPWIGVGMTLIAAGIAGAGVSAAVLNLAEPIGWWRLLAIPPAAFVVGFWAFVLLIGLPTSGGSEHDVATVLYSLPSFILVLVIATVAVALPPVGGRAMAKR